MNSLSFSTPRLHPEPRFGNAPTAPGDLTAVLPPVTAYSEEIPGGSKFLQLRKTQPPGVKNPWQFAHRPNSTCAVHALTLITDKDDNSFVHLLITKRPALGGKLTIELPAGLCGDGDATEKALDAANREVKEETGYTVERSKLLSNQLFATSPGMTTEMKAFAITLVSGNPSSDYQEGDEKSIIVGKLNVPLETFVNYDKFTEWLQKMQKDYIVGMDVIAARGLMPPQVGQRLSAEA